MMNEIEAILKNFDISPTPVRILVYRRLDNSKAPMSLSELEEELETIDKSSISRTLSLFREHHLIHSFNDGSGSMKYELCRSHDHEQSSDLHVHFRCEQCGETKCLTNVKIPEVSLPAGFLRHESTYVITGICDLCNKSKRMENE